MRLSEGVKTGVLGLLMCIPVASVGAGTLVVALRSSDLSVYDDAIQGFKKEFSAAKGPIDLRVETLTDPSSAASLLTSIDQSNPAVVLALGSQAARLARKQLKSAPVVFCMVLDPGDDLSYAGVSLNVRLADYHVLAGKSLPGVKKLGLIYNPATSGGLMAQVKALEAKGQMVGFAAATTAEADQALSSMKGKVDALLLLPEPTLFPPQVLGPFLKQSIELSVPVIGFSLPFVKAGAVAAFFADYRDNGELAGQLAVRVMNGEALKALPILAPARINAGYNLIVARHINQQIDPKALDAAVDVIR
jgi:putative ABC transport system substrate-binding protein